MLVSIDERDPLPPGEQLRSQLVLLILSGTLAEGARLPSVRRLSADLKLAPGTVARVYKDLETSGHLETSGSGTRVGYLGSRADQERRELLEDAARTFVQHARRAGFQMTDAVAMIRRVYKVA